jgi:hypothetical protein
MTRPARRASEATLNTVHRLVGRELARQLRKAARGKESASAALLTAAISYLKLTDTREPAPPSRKPDRLAALLPSDDELDELARR